MIRLKFVITIAMTPLADESGVVLHRAIKANDRESSGLMQLCRLRQETCIEEGVVNDDDLAALKVHRRSHQAEVVVQARKGRLIKGARFKTRIASAQSNATSPVSGKDMILKIHWQRR